MDEESQVECVVLEYASDDGCPAVSAELCPIHFSVPLFKGERCDIAVDDGLGALLSVDQDVVANVIHPDYARPEGGKHVACLILLESSKAVKKALALSIMGS